MNHGWKVLGNIGYTENSQLRREEANSQIIRKKNGDKIREDCITQVSSRTLGIKGLIGYICVDKDRSLNKRKYQRRGENSALCNGVQEGFWELRTLCRIRSMARAMNCWQKINEYYRAVGD